MSLIVRSSDLFIDLRRRGNLLRHQLRLRLALSILTHNHHYFRVQYVLPERAINEAELADSLDICAANAIAQLLTIPPYTVAAVTSAVTAYASDRLQSRGLFVCAGCLVSAVGYSCVFHHSDCDITKWALSSTHTECFARNVGYSWP